MTMKRSRLSWVVSAVAATIVAGCLLSSDADAQSKAAATEAQHKLAIQVDEKNPAIMKLALNNAQNVIKYYQAKGESVLVEIVAYGPGLHMLRTDTSPVKDRIATMALEHPNLSFVSCKNTERNMSKQEKKPISLISEARSTESGVVRLMELQKQGYAYIRP